MCCATGQARRLQPAAPADGSMHSGVPACLAHRDFAGLPALAVLWPPAASIVEAGCCFQALLTTATGLPPDQQQVLQLRTKLGDWLGGSVFDKAQQLWKACGQPFEVVERMWDPGGFWSLRQVLPPTAADDACAVAVLQTSWLTTTRLRQPWLRACARTS